MDEILVRSAESAGDIETVRVLLREYGDHLVGSLGAENMCMSRYEEELATLPGPYCLLLVAYAGDEPAGCVLLKAIQRADEKACELKRLWVRPQFRGLRIGRTLSETAMGDAKARGYTTIYLDTVPAAMQAAHRMYQELGFEPVERYNENSVSDVQFFRRPL